MGIGPIKQHANMFDLDPPYFMWVEKQLIHEGNLLAHINVHIVAVNYVNQQSNTKSEI